MKAVALKHRSYNETIKSETITCSVNDYYFALHTCIHALCGTKNQIGMYSKGRGIHLCSYPPFLLPFFFFFLTGQRDVCSTHFLSCRRRRIILSKFFFFPLLDIIGFLFFCFNTLLELL